MGWKWDVNGMLIRQFTYMHIICRVVNGGKMLEPYSMRRALELLRAFSHPHAENPWAETEIKTCDVGWYIAFEVQKDVFWQKIPCSMEIYYGLWGPVCHPRVITGDGRVNVGRSSGPLSTQTKSASVCQIHCACMMHVLCVWLWYCGFPPNLETYVW